MKLLKMWSEAKWSVEMVPLDKGDSRGSGRWPETLCAPALLPPTFHLPQPLLGKEGRRIPTRFSVNPLGLTLLLTLIAFTSSSARDHELLQEQVSQREDLRLLQEKIGQLENDLQALKTENGTMTDSISRLKTDLAASRKSHEQLQKDVERLDVLVRKLDAAREQDRKTIVEEVGREINRLSPKSPPKPPSSQGKTEKPKVQEGVEHTVEKGETLTAIAEAYSVSKKNIREANHLTGSDLKVGQKLFIPKRVSEK